MRGLDAACAGRDGSREGTARMSEEFGFEQLLGYRCAVQHHKRLSGAGAESVHGACNQFFAGTGFALNQHTR